MRGIYVRDEETKEIDKLRAKAAQLGFSDYELRESRIKIPEDFGLCRKCEYANLVKSADKVLYAKCDVLSGLRLSIEHPVTECSSFFRRGHPSIENMYRDAILINVPKGGKVGFIKEEDIKPIKEKK